MAAVYLLLCFGSLSCDVTQFHPHISCQTDDLLFHSRILGYTEEFTVDSMNAPCPGVVAAKQT